MIIHDPEEMRDFGKKMSGKYSEISLYGELGAGKTQFAKGFAEGLAIDSQEVHSPTYTYLNVYQDKLLHVDMYRLEKLEELIERGIIEEIDSYDFVLVEWPKFEDHREDDDFKKIQFKKKENQNEREINFLN